MFSFKINNTIKLTLSVSKQCIHVHIHLHYINNAMMYK